MPDSKSPAENSSQGGIEPAPSRAVAPVSHDVVLKFRVLHQLESSAELAGADINVVVRNRSATLFGSVANEAQRALSQRLTIAVSGIIEVSNRLRISAT